MGRGVWWNTSSLLLETRVSLTLHQLQLCSRCFQVLSLLCFRFESNRCGCCFRLTCAAGIYFHSHLTLLLPPAYLTSFYLSIFSLISFLHLSSWRGGDGWLPSLLTATAPPNWQVTLLIFLLPQQQTWDYTGWWAACWSAERQIAVSVARLKSHKEMWREVFPFGLSPQQQQLFNCWWVLSNLYVFDRHQLLNIDRYFKAIKVWNQQMDLRLFRLRSVTGTNSSINHRGCYQLDNLAMSYQLRYDVFIWKRQNL